VVMGGGGWFGGGGFILGGWGGGWGKGWGSLLIFCVMCERPGGVSPLLLSAVQSESTISLHSSPLLVCLLYSHP
jgi:hypothetical protein